LQTQFDRFTDHGELRVPVRCISLVSYAASEIGGPLTTLADYDFARDNLRWTESLPSELQAFARVT
jgi:hypothetical protein